MTTLLRNGQVRGALLRTTLLTTVTSAILATAAHAAPAVIGGLVVDRNNKPLARAIVSLAPGNVELVTDRDGKFTIDYLRDATGERIKLSKKTSYTLVVFKPGFHTVTTHVEYRHGELQVDPVTMTPETIAVQEIAEDISADTKTTTSTGATYEGQ